MSRPDPSKPQPEAVQRVMSYDANTIAKIFESKFPQAWNRMCTRSIDSPPNYYPYRCLPVMLTAAIEEHRESEARGEDRESNIGFIAGMLETYDFPLFYVSGALLTALGHTSPPDDFTWEKIAFPYPALCFMIPKGSISEPPQSGGKDIILLGVAKMNAGSKLSIPTLGDSPVRLPYDRISVFWCVAPNGAVISDCTFPTTQPIHGISEWLDDNTPAARGYTGPHGEFNSRIIGLAANLLLLMQAEPQLIEPSRMLRKRTESRIEQRSATFLGRRYETARREEASSSTDLAGHFTELGWRRGHFKRQHFGPKNKEIKTIFVEPYMAFTRGLRAGAENA